MVRTRSPAVAGAFYPDDRAVLSEAVRGYVSSASAVEGAPPKALIAPHAGFVYSGPVAGTAYRCLAPLRDRIRRVVLLGPSHRVAFRGIAAPTSDRFETPLGVVSVDRKAFGAVEDLPQLVFRDDAHRLEHSLEVQLPFLQIVLGDFALVPLVVGEANAEEVAEVLDRLWDGDETLIVVSSDLSHYHDYERARALDARTTRAIESLQPEAIDFEDACGAAPVRGLLVAARARGMTARAIDVRSSGDTAGPRDRVVGYGAYVFA
jgi:AmmeMemoRadiSam system protein B